MAEKRVEAAENQDLSLEERLMRLEEIVEALEEESTTLARAVELYEEGTKLAGVCRKELASAEQKITELRKNAEGNDEEGEFSGDL